MNYKFDKDIDRKVREGQSPLFNWSGKGIRSSEHFKARVNAQIKERIRQESIRLASRKKR